MNISNAPTPPKILLVSIDISWSSKYRIITLGIKALLEMSFITLSPHKEDIIQSPIFPSIHETSTKVIFRVEPKCDHIGTWSTYLIESNVGVNILM
jgi:hypothetical protein